MVVAPHIVFKDTKACVVQLIARVCILSRSSPCNFTTPALAIYSLLVLSGLVADRCLAFGSCFALFPQLEPLFLRWGTGRFERHAHDKFLYFILPTQPEPLFASYLFFGGGYGMYDHLNGFAQAIFRPLWGSSGC